ncbi:MAG: hypothetical protein HUU50_20730 [Candidatus Brocadiae bacterium]|nr:hypothetical protein [Candidatus Brocadiia bacterium]
MAEKFCCLVQKHYRKNSKVYKSIAFSFFLHGTIFVLFCLPIWDFSLKDGIENLVNIELGFSQESQEKPEQNSKQENLPGFAPALPLDTTASQNKKSIDIAESFSSLEKIKENLNNVREEEDSLNPINSKPLDSLYEKEKQIQEQLAQREKIRSMLLSDGVDSKKIQDSRGKDRQQLLQEGGGGRNTENAVQAGLEWLHKHQSQNGSWDADNFMACCKEQVSCSDAGVDWADPAVTGLALLAFLGNGSSTKEGKYKDTLDRGLSYLLSIQEKNGCYGKAYLNHLYNHAIATFAMCEAYTMCHEKRFRQSATKGVLYILEGQNPGMAWRYTPLCGDNDTSVTGWCLLALKAALNAEIQVPLKSIESSKVWLDYVTMKGEEPWAGYTSPDKNYTMTAVAAACRIFFHTPQDTPVILGAGKILYNNPPSSAQQKDYYYWYYGTLAMYQIGKSHWNTWNQILIKTLLGSQEKAGCLKGSWGQGRFSGGRVYCTAMAVLCLEVYYRYPRIFKH